MNNPMLAEVARAYYEERVQQAQANKLARAALPKMPGPRVRTLVRIGDCLISFGNTLKTRYQPITYEIPAEMEGRI